MDDFRDKVERYLADELGDAEHRELTRWLEADEANRQAFLAEVDFFRTVRNVLIQEQQDLATLAEASGADELPPIHLDATALTKKKYVSALSYVISHTFTPKRLIACGLAAAVMLGAVLAITLITGGPEQPAEITQAPEPAGIDEPVVATLTATQNAEWAEGAFAPGFELQAGQTLTLTEGFAKLTTRRGAAALLEAPCKIELIDSPNAIRLHAGKLVGICETQRSQGFLVRTPHMDITDIGTRFSVTTDDTTRVHVIQGEVEAANELTDTPITLIAGQTAEVNNQTRRIAIVESVNDRFVTDWNAIITNPQLSGEIPLRAGDPAGPARRGRTKRRRPPLPRALGRPPGQADHRHIRRAGRNSAGLI